MTKYLKENNIFQKLNEVGDHNVLGIIDRFSQTIKRKSIKISRILRQLNGWIN